MTVHSWASAQGQSEDSGIRTSNVLSFGFIHLTTCRCSNMVGYDPDRSAGMAFMPAKVDRNHGTKTKSRMPGLSATSDPPKDDLDLTGLIPNGGSLLLRTADSLQ